MKLFINRILTIAVSISAFGIGLSSCTQEDLEAPVIDIQEGPSLELYISRETSTRAITPGTSFTKAEKVVTSVDLFFYETDASDA